MAALSDEADFWEWTRVPDACVPLAVMSGGMSRDHETEIIEQYGSAWRQLGPPMQLRSVLGQFEFLEDALTGVKAAKPAIMSVERVRKALAFRIKSEGEA